MEKRINFKKMVLAFSIAFLMLPIQAAWSEEAPAESPVGVSMNAAQTSRVDNLAAQSVDLAGNKALQDAIKEMEAAQAALDKSPTGANLEALREALEEAQGKVDGLTAAAMGVARDEIVSMRDAGMGWGQIAHELGLHPSVLGLGHQKSLGNINREASRTATQDKTASMGLSSQATSRNIIGGTAQGHGLKSDGTSLSANQGLGSQKSKDDNVSAGSAGGKSNAAGGNGPGQGKENSSGGHGNGKDKS